MKDFFAQLGRLLRFELRKLTHRKTLYIASAITFIAAFSLVSATVENHLYEEMDFMVSSLTFGQMLASAMSSVALSGSAAASTTRPCASSRTGSQLTVSGSSGYGESACKTGVATATGSPRDSAGTRTILTSRRPSGNASTASPRRSPAPNTLNWPPSKAAIWTLSAIKSVVYQKMAACGHAKSLGKLYN